MPNKTEIPSLPPITLPNSATADPGTIRQNAVNRQTDMPSVRQGKKKPKSVENRQKRMVTVTLPTQDLRERLTQGAEKARIQSGNDATMTDSHFAMLLLIAALNQWEQGQLNLSKTTHAKESFLVIPRQSTE